MSFLTPTPPAKAVDRPVPRIGKRDTPKEAPSQAPNQAPRENNGRRGGRVTAGNEAAFRDRNAGRSNNRSKPTDEAEQPTRRGGNRGGRGDRQSRTGHAVAQRTIISESDRAIVDTRKQVQQGWGAESGEKAFDDERAAEKIAKDEENEPQTPAAEEEEVDKSKSFSEYLAEKAQRESLAAKPIRAANEGSKDDKKWAGATELKQSEEDSYIQPSLREDQEPEAAQGKELP
ncbi:hypothetical protein N7470_002297 [Penicillium chermesinum]|nr:hypothetical protein N7470_002297 [Penicillium chermesinum]